MALAKRDEHHHQSPHEAPTVGRPRGALWRSLQADGVVWEGQVLLVGGDVDLAARMIVTHRRVVFVRGGEVVLEIPRGWLRQEPVLRRDGVLDIFVTTPESNPFDEPMRCRSACEKGIRRQGTSSPCWRPAACGALRRTRSPGSSAPKRRAPARPPPRASGLASRPCPPSLQPRASRIPSSVPAAKPRWQTITCLVLSSHRKS